MIAVRGYSRRDVLRAAGGLGAVAFVGDSASAEHDRNQEEDVTVEYDESLIREYQPDLVLTGVDPRPSAFHALHATKDGTSLNAVYGFAKYPFQEGRTDHDSHLGDHEPMIVWYDDATGETERVDYAAFHWFRERARGSNLEYATDARKRPVFAVDPDYHHYYRTTADAPGELIETRNLLDTIDLWLDEGMEEELALSQPYNPWAMLSRDHWWRDGALGPVDRALMALYFNSGLSGATETSDLGRVDPW